MIFGFSLCSCCGHTAVRREILYQEPNWPTPSHLIPDICDACWSDILSHHTGNGVYEEYARRAKEFKERYTIVDLVPVIEINAGALDWSI